MAHISWSDSRNNPDPRYFEIYYDRSNLGTTAIEDHDKGNLAPDRISVWSYPNPFNSKTIINIKTQMTQGGDIKLEIFDIIGRLVKRFDIVESALKGGTSAQINWDASDASGKMVNSGIYFARASTLEHKSSIKLLYLK